MKSNQIFNQLTYSLLLALAAFHIVTAQPIQIYSIETHPIEVSAERTVALSFPNAITSVDRGSSQILAQKAKGSENVLLLKAGQKNIAPTSLIVITADGAIHNFEVSYHDHPSSLHVLSNVASGQAAKSSARADKHQLSEAIKLAGQYPPNRKKRINKGQISGALEGLFIKGQFMLIRLSLENQSVIDYDIESIRMFVSDKKQIKRNASQEDEVIPIEISGDIYQLRASEQKTLILTIPKMTIPKSKRFVIEINEKGGARGLILKLNSKQLGRVAAL